MFRQVPNALTASRLLLAGVFFAILSIYHHDGSGDVRLLNIAFFVYLLALFTDFLDGFLARRWKVVGAFGRVVDPFVDKVLVLGSFIYFAGINFTVTRGDGHVESTSGVLPWMVVVILARELLVTSLRGELENTGQEFAARLSGKLKMVLQSITILMVLEVANYSDRLGPQWRPIAEIARGICIWATLVITVFSGMSYVGRAVALFRKREKETS